MMKKKLTICFGITSIIVIIILGYLCVSNGQIKFGKVEKNDNPFYCLYTEFEGEEYESKYYLPATDIFYDYGNGAKFLIMLQIELNDNRYPGFYIHTRYLNTNYYGIGHIWYNNVELKSDRGVFSFQQENNIIFYNRYHTSGNFIFEGDYYFLHDDEDLAKLIEVFKTDKVTVTFSGVKDDYVYTIPKRHLDVLKSILYLYCDLTRGE